MLRLVRRHHVWRISTKVPPAPRPVAKSGRRSLNLRRHLLRRVGQKACVMARVRGGDERELQHRQLTEEAMANSPLGIGLTHCNECVSDRLLASQHSKKVSLTPCPSPPTRTADARESRRRRLGVTALRRASRPQTRR